MPAINTRLFRPETLRSHLRVFSPPPGALAARPRFAEWAAELAAGTFDKAQETDCSRNTWCRSVVAVESVGLVAAEVDLLAVQLDVQAVCLGTGEGIRKVSHRGTSQ